MTYEADDAHLAAVSRLTQLAAACPAEAGHRWRARLHLRRVVRRPGAETGLPLVPALTGSDAGAPLP